VLFLTVIFCNFLLLDFLLRQHNILPDKTNPAPSTTSRPVLFFAQKISPHVEEPAGPASVPGPAGSSETHIPEKGEEDEDEDEEDDGSVSYIDHYAGSVEVHLRYDGSRGKSCQRSQWAHVSVGLKTAFVFQYLQLKTSYLANILK
jgi:hypothetical protein